jgi:hypothetical protein
MFRFSSSSRLRPVMGRRRPPRSSATELLELSPIPGASGVAGAFLRPFCGEGPRGYLGKGNPFSPCPAPGAGALRHDGHAEFRQGRRLRGGSARWRLATCACVRIAISGAFPGSARLLGRAQKPSGTPRPGSTKRTVKSEVVEFSLSATGESGDSIAIAIGCCTRPKAERPQTCVR